MSKEFRVNEVYLRRDDTVVKFHQSSDGTRSLWSLVVVFNKYNGLRQNLMYYGCYADLLADYRLLRSQGYRKLTDTEVMKLKKEKLI